MNSSLSEVAPQAPRLSTIWAQAAGGIIGAAGTMPWSVPADLAFFKKHTSGCPVIMGRPTWESFPSRFRPLPGRTNIVVTRALPAPSEGDEVSENVPEAVLHDGALWCSSLEAAIGLATTSCPKAPEIWIIGGAQVYAQALALTEVPGVVDGRVTRALVTELQVRVDGDRTAPQLGSEWHPRLLGDGIEERGAVADTSGSHVSAAVAYRFLEYTR